VVVGLTLVACATQPSPRGASASEPRHPEPLGVPSHPTTRVDQDQQPGQVAEGRVASDLERLADRFTAYAVGDAASFPHRESVSMAIGGESVKSIDDIGAALSNRDIWRMCPGDWDGYAAASCPVDLLGAIKDAVANGASLVYEPDYGAVTCAPLRTGPPPEGRLVIVRPPPERRTCATDFALSLVADQHGRLRSVDLTLSAP
jgi:hypothetical protein